MSSSNNASPSGGATGHHANPMDQYLQALPSSTSETQPNAGSVRAIIHQALTNPRIHAGFAELRSHPAVGAALDRSGAGDDPALRTLELFAYGTYRDYADSAPGTYLSLTDAQLAKLRQLTVVTLAQRSAASGAAGETATAVAGSNKIAKKKKDRRGRGGGTAVPYDLLRSELGMTDAPLRDVEDLLISCLYAGLVSGKLDQRSMSLRVEGSASSAHGGQQPPVAARDVRLEHIPRMIDELEQFRARSADVLRSLEGAASAARDGRAGDADVVRTMEEAATEARERAKAKLGAGGPGGVLEEVPFGGADGSAWSAAAAAAAAGGLDGGPAAMDLSLEGCVGVGGRPSGTVRRQTKRSRGGHGGPEAFGRF